MPSDRTKQTEETTGEEHAAKPSQQEHQPLGNTAQQTAEETRQAQEDFQIVERSEMLSEAAFDFGFAIFEAIFALSALIVLVISVTTSVTLFQTAGGLMMLAGIFAIVQKFIKRFDEMWLKFSE